NRRPLANPKSRPARAPLPGPRPVDAPRPGPTPTTGPLYASCRPGGLRGQAVRRTGRVLARLHRRPARLLRGHSAAVAAGARQRLAQGDRHPPRPRGPGRVTYLDLTGRGVETVAHLCENGRVTLMSYAFAGRLPGL